MITILEGEVTKTELRRTRLQGLLDRTVQCLRCKETFVVDSLDAIVESENDYTVFNLKCPHCKRLVDYVMAERTDEQVIQPYFDKLTKLDDVRAHHPVFKKVLLAVYKEGYEAFEESVLTKEHQRGMADALSHLKRQILEQAGDKFQRGQDQEAERLRDLANNLHLPK